MFRVGESFQFLEQPATQHESMTRRIGSDRMPREHRSTGRTRPPLGNRWNHGAPGGVSIFSPSFDSGMPGISDAFGNADSGISSNDSFRSFLASIE